MALEEKCLLIVIRGFKHKILYENKCSGVSTDCGLQLYEFNEKRVE